MILPVRTSMTMLAGRGPAKASAVKTKPINTANTSDQKALISGWCMPFDEGDTNLNCDTMLLFVFVSVCRWEVRRDWKKSTELALPISL